MPTFVTGGTGFLGVNLVRDLVARGERVRLLVRPRSSRLGLASDLIEFVAGDVTDLESVLQAMRGCERVYHLAAWVQITPWDHQTARRVNVEGTRNVCNAAMQCGVQRLVHTSSIATMGCGTIEQPADEETPCRHEGFDVPYYATKRESENIVRESASRGLDAVIANPSYLVGPWDVKRGAGRPLIMLAKGLMPVCPSGGGINFVDVREAAAGLIKVMERGRTGGRYFLGGENLSYKTFIHRAAEIIGVRPPRLTCGYATMYPFALAGSLLGCVAPRLFQDINLCVLRSCFLEHYVSSRKACAELGYREIPVDQAVADAIQWFVEHGYLPRTRSLCVASN